MTTPTTPTLRPPRRGLAALTTSLAVGTVVAINLTFGAGAALANPANTESGGTVATAHTDPAGVVYAKNDGRFVRSVEGQKVWVANYCTLARAHYDWARENLHKAQTNSEVLYWEKILVAAIADANKKKCSVE